MVIGWLLLLLLLLSPPAWAASVIGPAAAALAPGQWTTVPMSNVNLTSKTTQPGAAWSVDSSPGGFYNGPQPGWDSTARKLYIEIGDHSTGAFAGDCPGFGVLTTFPTKQNTCWRPIWTYDDATDTWTVDGPFPKRNNGTGVPGAHVYGQIAWNDTDKVMYIRSYDSTDPMVMVRYCVNATPSYCAAQGANSWKEITGPTVNHYPSGDSALAWMPSLNGGTLLYYAGVGAGGDGTCGSLVGYKEGNAADNGTWSVIDSGTSPPCKFTGPTAYLYAIPSPTKSITMFGGGYSPNWWKIDSAGTITRLDNHPTGCTFGSSNGTQSQGAADPVSGDAYFIGCTSGGQFWRLNPTGTPGSQWTLIQNNPAICTPSRFPAEPCGADFYLTSISTYGVIGAIRFTSGSPNTSEYWIYKATAGGGGDITPPTVSVTAPTAGATVSGAAVPLSANASDNVAVVGVQFKVDGGNVSVEDTTSPYSITWDSTTVANGAHLITAFARDAAGNTTTSGAISVTVANGGGGGGADFATRCKAAGVVLCVGFDSAAEIACKNPTVLGGSSFQYCNNGIDQIGSTTAPVIDTVNKASGGGSLKMTIDSRSGANGGGAYFTNFDQTNALSKQYGAGDTIYVQWRQRFSPEFLATQYLVLGGGGLAGGWKQISMTTGDQPSRACPPQILGNYCTSIFSAGPTIAQYSSCTPIDVPTQNTNQRGVVQAYNSCTGSQSHGAYSAFIRQISGTIDQNGACGPVDCYLQDSRPAPNCLYSQGSPPNSPSGFLPPTGNCFGYFANEWMTFKVKLTLGTRTCIVTGSNYKQCEFVNSHFDMWVAREGQPSQQVFNFGPYNISALNMPCASAGCVSEDDPNEKFGKIYLLPYHSYKDDTQVHPTGYVWYDDLIISTQDIADPGGGTIAPPSNVNLARRRIQ